MQKQYEASARNSTTGYKSKFFRGDHDITVISCCLRTGASPFFFEEEKCSLKEDDTDFGLLQNRLGRKSAFNQIGNDSCSYFALICYFR